jgi:hypothetical protein
VTKAEGTVFQDSFYFLTAKAIQSLYASGKLLVRSVKYPVHMNPYERKHDLLAQTVRIAFENSQDLKDIFWVSDFEMRSAITPEIKTAFLIRNNGVLNGQISNSKVEEHRMATFRLT